MFRRGVRINVWGPFLVVSSAPGARSHQLSRSGNLRYWSPSSRSHEAPCTTLSASSSALYRVLLGFNGLCWRLTLASQHMVNALADLKSEATVSARIQQSSMARSWDELGQCSSLPVLYAQGRLRLVCPSSWESGP